MPAASSIYWNSVDSQRSSDSSADAVSARHYIDPWDLENYAYLRRHSIATTPHQQQQQQRPQHQTSQRITYSRVSHHQRRNEPEPQQYWSTPREPGYHAPSSVDEHYFGGPPSSRQMNHSSSHYQPIYEEHTRYSAPLYAPLSDLDARHEDQRLKEMLRRRKVSRTPIIHGRESGIYHNTSSNVRRDSVEQAKQRMIKGEEECYFNVIPPSNLGLNNYGHLKIDYTNSWNSLHRKIAK